jgi:hypothetical protein
MLHRKMVRRQAGPIPSAHPFEKRFEVASDCPDIEPRAHCGHVPNVLSNAMSVSLSS